LHPGSHGVGRLVSNQLPRLTGRAPQIGSPAWTRTTTIRLTGGHAPLTLQGNEGAPGKSCTCVNPFRRRMPPLLGHESVWLEKWSRAPVLPRASPRSRRGGFDGSLARDESNWRTLAVTLRRYCLDRALCCYYTKGPKWWVRSVTLRHGLCEATVLRTAHDLYVATHP
jgi:hypothetical protein